MKDRTRVQLLCRHTDEEVARRTGRTANAVRLERQKLGVARKK